MVQFKRTKYPEGYKTEPKIKRRKRNKSDKNTYKYNLPKLEDNITLAYQLYKNKDNQKTRTDLFTNIKKLAFAYLVVTKWKDIDYEQISYEYSVYLFERIITNTFVPEPKEEGTRFPWCMYVSKNIRHIILSFDKSPAWMDLVADIETIIDYKSESIFTEAEKKMDDILIKKDLAHTLYKQLSMFYSDNEIKRLYFISMDLLNKPTDWTFVSSALPLDIKDFTITIICLAKRLSLQHGITYTSSVSMIEMRKALKSTMRSSLFLSAVVNSDFFPKELLLALDIDSLYRLVYICGGTSIKIPNLVQIDTMTGAVASISKMINEGKDFKSALASSKKDYGLIFSKSISIQSYTSKIIEHHNLVGEDKPTDPLISMIMTSMKSLETLSNTLAEKADTLPPEALIKLFSEMEKSVNQTTQSLLSIKESVNKQKGI